MNINNMNCYELELSNTYYYMITLITHKNDKYGSHGIEPKQELNRLS